MNDRRAMYVAQSAYCELYVPLTCPATYLPSFYMPSLDITNEVHV